MGVSLVSQDYTKAACRAVQDALYRNSLSLPFVFGGTPADMIVELEVAVQQPDQVDIERVQKLIPHGKSSVSVVHGGLDIPQPNQFGTTTVANVAVVVYLDLEPGDRCCNASFLKLVQVTTSMVGTTPRRPVVPYRTQFITARSSCSAPSTSLMRRCRSTSQLAFRSPIRWIVTSLHVSCREGMFPSK